MVTQWVKCLLCKYEDLGSGLYNSHRSWVCHHIPVTLALDDGGRAGQERCGFQRLYSQPVWSKCQAPVQWETVLN